MILREDSLKARRHNIEIQGFLQKDSLQARQHSIEAQGFYMNIPSKQDNTALKHKDFTGRFTPRKTKQH